MSIMALSFEILLRRLKKRYVPSYLWLCLPRVSEICQRKWKDLMFSAFALRSA